MPRSNWKARNETLECDSSDEDFIRLDRVIVLAFSVELLLSYCCVTVEYGGSPFHCMAREDGLRF